MISKFQPANPLLSTPGLALLLALCCIPLTRAAEGQAALPAAGVKPKLSETERYALGIRRLEEEWAKQDQMVKQKQAELDRMKWELGISDLEASGPARNQVELDALRRLEVARIEAYADVERIQMLYSHLTNLTRVALRKAISTAAPDPQVTALFEQLATAEQKLAALTESQALDHPEVKSVHRVLEKINNQIDDRLDGILEGLKVKVEAEKARLQALQRELDTYKKLDIETAIKSRPYFQAKRDLETLQMVRERLALRILQEKMDAAIPKE